MRFIFILVLVLLSTSSQAWESFGGGFNPNGLTLPQGGGDLFPTHPRPPQRRWAPEPDCLGINGRPCPPAVIVIPTTPIPLVEPRVGIEGELCEYMDEDYVPYVSADENMTLACAQAESDCLQLSRVPETCTWLN